MIEAVTSQRPVVSVVIPTFNEEKNIRSCLGSILNQNTSASYEIMVVDSSTDSTPQIIQTEFPQVRLIHRDRQTFPAEARNIGIEHSQGDIVAFIDADCQAASLWIDAIVAAHRQSHLAVGGSVSLSRPHTVAGAVLFAVEFSEYLPGGVPREARWLPSCNLSVKREALRRYGGFPTEMEASEDMIFTRSLASRSGIPLWFDPRIMIAHSNVNTMDDVRRRLRRLGYWSGRSRQSGLLSGGFLLRFPWLIPLLVPYRLLTILWRFLHRSGHKKLLLLNLIYSPLLVYALCHWAKGFHRGARKAQEENRVNTIANNF
jgi:glycosyltransferase involved in cell wall biosynthesis